MRGSTLAERVAGLRLPYALGDVRNVLANNTSPSIFICPIIKIRHGATYDSPSTLSFLACRLTPQVVNASVVRVEEAGNPATPSIGVKQAGDTRTRDTSPDPTVAVITFKV